MKSYGVHTMFSTTVQNTEIPRFHRLWKRNFAAVKTEVVLSRVFIAGRDESPKVIAISGVKPNDGLNTKIRQHRHWSAV